MLSIVIPTWNAEATLPGCIEALREGLKALDACQIVIADGGSADDTLQLADAAGADIVRCEKGRGNQLAAGAEAARGDWLLFVHADTRLSVGWHKAVTTFVDAHKPQDQRRKAAVFRFRLNDASVKARCLELLVALRTRLLALPYGDQGLLISRDFYTELGGFKKIPIMEDVDLIWRIGRRALSVLPCDAMTSATRYQQDGYFRRMSRNVLCLSMWLMGAAPERITRVYR